MDIRDCIECSQAYQPITEDQRFCSRWCYADWHKKENKTKDDSGSAILRKCVVCGSNFRPISVRHKICSVECRRHEQNENMKAYYAAYKQRDKKQGDLACFKCKHWHPKKGADTGYQCVIARYMLCKPYLSTTKPFDPIEGYVDDGSVEEAD